jgi:hypothetical protein
MKPASYEGAGFAITGAITRECSAAVAGASPSTAAQKKSRPACASRLRASGEEVLL